MGKPKLFLFLSLLLLGFLLRLYRIDNPVADWHAFRQSDTAAVSQIFVNEDYNLLYPKYFDISNVQSGMDNPEGYRFVEFPIYNFLHAFLYKTIGVLSFEAWGRLASIVSSLTTAVIIFLLLKKHYNLFSAFAGLSFFLFLPFSIFYSRTILPDTMMTTSIMLGIYFFDKWIGSIKYQVLSIKYLAPFSLAVFFTALAFLLKPFALFFTLPMIYLAFMKFRFKVLIKWQMWLFAVLSLSPFIAWRLWISQFPEGIPVSAWLFNSNEIRFRPAFFRWIFYERVTKLIFGYFGILLLLPGIFYSFKNKRLWFFLSFGLSSLIYLSVIATGNIQHDYYQILIMPTLSMLAGIGVFGLFKILSTRLGQFLSFSALLIVGIASFYFAWTHVKDFFNINDRAMVEAGERANELIPYGALVIAPYDGSTTLLNITGRRGWPVFQASIEELIEKGAEYMVIASPTENDFTGFGVQYEIIDSSDKYLILKLR